MDVPSRAQMQGQRSAIDGDDGLAFGRDLVSPRVLGEGLRSEPEPASALQVYSGPLILADGFEKFGVRYQRLVRCLVKVFGSSSVISKSMCPKSRRWKRSVVRRASEWACP